VVPPDWGEDHLTPEAVVAFVDGELAPGPRARAVQHVDRCPECTAQVRGQRQARAELRTAGGPTVPLNLLSSLRSIPSRTDPSVFDAPTLPTAVPAAGRDDRRPARPPGPSGRRVRVGTVAATGLALGALAIGAAALSGGQPAAQPNPRPPGTVDAQLQLRPTSIIPVSTRPDH